MKNVLPILFFLFFAITIMAQNVGIGTTTPAVSAQLDVSSTTQGVLLPRMTTAQKNAIINPAEGLEVYDLTLHQKSYYNGTVWITLTSPSQTAVFLPTIVIGTQQWMSKNLEVAFYRNGDPIPQVTDGNIWVGLKTGAWCYYDNDSTQGAKYGKLYNWYAVNDSRGLAPQGWHIPSDAEWATLETTLGGSSLAGGKMKEAGTIIWGSPNTGGNNNSGFAGLPGGYRFPFGIFTSPSSYGGWWSATENLTNTAWYRLLGYNIVNLSRFDPAKAHGFSIRCVRD